MGDPGNVYKCQCCGGTGRRRRISPPPSSERTDLIAKAYRGRLSVDEVLFLVESLMWRSRNALEKGKPVRTAAPHSQPEPFMEQPEGLSAGLEITP